MTDENPERLRWWQGVPRYAWIVLAVSALGWLFDAMDQNLFNLVRKPSLKEILGPGAPESAVNLLAGQMTSIFLVGWAVGGFLFGMIGDRLGRARTMAITILIYAAFTGLNALARDPVTYGICRFLTALGVGGEFAAGAALVAEVFPARSRPMALGMLQALSAVGNMMAAMINLGLGAISWRWVYVVGALPAVMVFVIRRVIKEPDKWVEAKEKARAQELELGSIPGLFRDPVLRQNTIAGTLLALAGIGGLWGVGFFLTDLLDAAFKPQMDKAALNQFKSLVFFTQQVGAFLGIYAYALLSERTGRKPALLLFLILAFAAVQATFRFLHSVTDAYLLAFVLGFCALAPFSAYAVYFPELFPTRLRTTGVGFCYNCARLFAAAAPFALGQLAKTYDQPGDPSAGLRTAASVVAFIYAVGLVGLALAPETRGKPLPE